MGFERITWNVIGLSLIIGAIILQNWISLIAGIFFMCLASLAKFPSDNLKREGVKEK